MKTHVAEIPSHIPSRPPAIVEHVLLADLLDAFDARVDADGLDPDEVLVVIARRKLVDFAECARPSTDAASTQATWSACQGIASFTEAVGTIRHDVMPRCAICNFVFTSGYACLSQGLGKLF